jgi:hypothetical protein
MEILLPRREDNRMEFDKVTKHVKDNYGNPVGVANDSPVMDSQLYVVEWKDGQNK